MTRIQLRHFEEVDWIEFFREDHYNFTFGQDLKENCRWSKSPDHHPRVYIGCCREGTRICRERRGLITLEHSVSVPSYGFFDNDTKRIDNTDLVLCHNDVERHKMYVGCSPRGGGTAAHPLAVVLGMLLVISFIVNVLQCLKARKARKSRSEPTTQCDQVREATSSSLTNNKSSSSVNGIKDVEEGPDGPEERREEDRTVVASSAVGETHVADDVSGNINHSEP